MKKMKKFGSILMAGVLSLGLCALAACGDDDKNDDKGENATAYTVIVKDSEGNYVEGCKVGICVWDDEVNDKTTCYTPIASDANGKIVFEYPEGKYVLSDGDADDGYTVAEKTHFLTTHGTTTITVVVE